MLVRMRACVHACMRPGPQGGAVNMEELKDPELFVLQTAGQVRCHGMGAACRMPDGARLIMHACMHAHVAPMPSGAPPFPVHHMATRVARMSQEAPK